MSVLNLKLPECRGCWRLSSQLCHQCHHTVAGCGLSPPPLRWISNSAKGKDLKTERPHLDGGPWCFLSWDSCSAWVPYRIHNHPFCVSKLTTPWGFCELKKRRQSKFIFPQVVMKNETSFCQTGTAPHLTSSELCLTNRVQQCQTWGSKTQTSFADFVFLGSALALLGFVVKRKGSVWGCWVMRRRRQQWDWNKFRNYFASRKQRWMDQYGKDDG